MPRRKTPHPLAAAVGRRIRKLREEAGLTIEKLAFESDLQSKGHLSSIEKGLVMPTVATLAAIAERLDVLVVDVVNEPEAGERQKLIELSRSLQPGTLRKLVREMSAAGRRGDR
jgi:transcriptional regulator with XRE-family HTH domain